ncbi:glycogen debranching N-terminal domain-containing protein [Arthrobacter sp. efr-133-TYG-104]|uniref:amylo-alpha-1,6-glucosidase n=1 Tax=Arthrobacter sp. efr-133-TYG-104 TaxID=3040324 RepID=UPI00254F6985|nr:glycogen debranching N-terminal domain-containing protein [Arthrobacter sp. efr-133-TYG-104]
MTGWNADTAAGPLGPGSVTLVEGSSFCISLANGDMQPLTPNGLFYEDSRYLSTWNLTVNGQTLEPLATEATEPYRGLFVCRAPRSDGLADSPLVVERLRELSGGIAEEITIWNYSAESAACHVVLQAGVDFADLFEVKEAQIKRVWDTALELGPGTLTIRGSWGDIRKKLVVTASGAVVEGDALTYRIVIPPHKKWTARLTAEPASADDDRTALFDHAAGELLPSDQRRKEWVAKIPVLQMGNISIERTLRRSYDDLGALRIQDPNHPDRVVVAAGAPWFMTLFGRDSLWASVMAMPVDPSLALGTVQTLAEHQGRVVNAINEEEPGKILHEVRFGSTSRLALAEQHAYYGSVDATLLFLIVLGEMSRWGFSPEVTSALLPNADAALSWIRDYGDKDGDGFVEYARLNNRGLINQGWKDSWDGVNFADGTLAEPPIALCEVQGYLYGAYIWRAWMAFQERDFILAADLRSRAERLKRDFNQKFWLPERGYYAVALDRNKNPVDACASNMGHCLWNGIVDEDKAPLVVKRLMSRQMFSGWGIRTLASDMGAYNPASYYNGSIWPHDNAIIAAGLLRYGFVEEAQQISTALLEAAQYFNGRLPELFCGFDRSRLKAPIPYPTACSPQAWAAATPIFIITNLMRYYPHVALGGLWMDPVIPESYGDLHISNAPMAGRRITIDIINSKPSVEGLPEGMTLHHGHRPWMTEMVKCRFFGLFRRFSSYLTPFPSPPTVRVGSENFMSHRQ